MRRLFLLIFAIYFLIFFSCELLYAQEPTPMPTITVGLNVADGSFEMDSYWNSQSVGPFASLEQYHMNTRGVHVDTATAQHLVGGSGMSTALNIDARTQMIGDYGTEEAVGNSVITETCCENRAAGVWSDGRFLSDYETASVTVNNGQIGFAVRAAEIHGSIGASYREQTICVFEDEEDGSVVTTNTKGLERVEVWPWAVITNFQFDVTPNMDPRGVVPEDELKPLDGICPWGPGAIRVDTLGLGGAEEETLEEPTVGFRVGGGSSAGSGGVVPGLCVGCGGQ